MEGINTYHLTDDFISKLASFIEENYSKKGRDLGRLAVVFGGKRPHLFLQKELSRRIKNCFFAPRFFSIDEFVGYILEKKGEYRRISDLDARFTIYSLAQRYAPQVLKGRETFSSFLDWAKEISGFIEQLDLEDVKIKSLKDIQLNASIGYDVPEAINKLLSHIVTLRDAFHKVLLKEKACSRGLSYILAQESINEVSFDEFDSILFCNFFYLHKTEEAIMKALYEKGKASLFFQGDEREWSVLEKISKSFNSPIRPKNDRAPAYEVSIDCGFDLHSEVCLIRERLKTIDKPEDTVIVVPDPGALIPLLSEIAPLVNDFNVSMGYPVTRSSLYSLFEDLFKAQETKKGASYYTKDYLRLLSHPIIKNLSFLGESSMTRVLVHKIEEVMTGIEETSLGGSLFIELKDLEEEEALFEAAYDICKRMDIKAATADLKAAVKELHRILFTSWEDIGNFYEFGLIMEEFLSLLLNKSSLDKYPLNLKIIDRIFSIIDEFRNSSFNKEAFLKEEMFKIFRSKLENEMVSFTGSPLKGLQILGLLETRSLTFENVIVMDVNEAVLPKLKIYEPLIPREVMMGLGLNRLEKEEEIQRYQFMRLISSARKVFLFYQETEDKEKSRLIEELVWNKQKAIGELDVLPVRRAGFQMKVSPREIEAAKKPQTIAFLKEYRYSASSINTYLHCPLRFYYQYVLGLEEREDSLEEPESREMGTFIHSVLEEAFLKFVGKKPSIDDPFKEYFFDTLDKKFDVEFRRKMKSDAFLVMEVLKFRLGKFLDNEKKRDVRELVCVEKVFQDKIPLECGSFMFKSKIDRIDRLQDSSLLIIDYKTGAADIMPRAKQSLEGFDMSRQSIKERVKSFQLPLYYYFVRQNQNKAVINAALYNLRNPRDPSGLKKLFDDDEPIEQREEAIGAYMKALSAIISEILDPDTGFQADRQDAYYCENCPFFYLCR